MKKLAILLMLPMLLSGCFSTPAVTVNNICTLMDEEVSWYRSVKAAEKKYGAPAHVSLAIMYQESNFASDAKPPREKLFGVVPWFRPTTAYGFAQVTDDTWEWYQLKTGNHSADRDDFDDAADFVGWYIVQSSKRLGIAKSDAYNQYLAYHEGLGGFKSKSYNKKPWLKKIAAKVDNNAQRYKRQLNQCASDLNSNSIWSLF
ncbi:MAG: transglycosylase SLT domain-containing protein [Proteobacteria bacterium]|nr:transglycosylase SLT domain-containing protein [Pseudomonadota bacterium]MCH9711884.1 transglycosylase SLT domain-containing protein [Pseudomonadota bacterium]MCH9750054.1 transglycosylase SLT domain-containing protein [Pseudomonadota bacterium]